jgi:hypothetical protein
MTPLPQADTGTVLVVVVGPGTVVVLLAVVVVVVGATLVEVARLVVAVVSVLVVVVGAQPLSPQASQQLARWPMHPPALIQRSALVTLQRMRPLRPGRQQVTTPDLPQVERVAHVLTVPLQLRGRVPSATSCFRTPAAQAVYSRRLPASHAHAVAMATRAAATADASAGSSPHAA